MATLKRELTYKQHVEVTAIIAEIIKAVADNDMPRLLEMKDTHNQWVCDQIDQAVLAEIMPYVNMTVTKTRN